MPWKERMIILDNLHMTDDVIAFDDSDGTACDAIRKVKQKYPGSDIVFANGGDRTADNIPEMIFNDVEFIFSVGGDDKQNSSSWILEEWKAPKTERQWGYYRVLHEVPGCKVKELTVDPGKSLSMQRHDYRAEHWMVSEGECIINSKMPTGYALPPRHLTRHQAVEIPLGEWHQLTNPFDAPCRIVEIQYGKHCIEEDIERE